MQQCSTGVGILGQRMRRAEAAGRAWAMHFGYAGIGVGNEVVPSPLLCLTQERYYVLYIQPNCIHRRKFDPKGNEIEPNFSATRKVNTGFLMSSYSRYPGLFLPKRLLDCPVCPLRFLKVASQNNWLSCCFWLECPLLISSPQPLRIPQCPVLVLGARLAFLTASIS